MLRLLNTIMARLPRELLKLLDANTSTVTAEGDRGECPKSSVRASWGASENRSIGAYARKKWHHRLLTLQVDRIQARRRGHKKAPRQSCEAAHFISRRDFFRTPRTFARAEAARTRIMGTSIDYENKPIKMHRVSLVTANSHETSPPR